MFKILLTTKVHAPIHTVQQHFGKELFLQLNPPFPKATLQRYDGNQTGNEVWIQLHFGFFTSLWKSTITSELQTEDQYVFVDEGTHLPFFLSQWRHIHQVKRISDQQSLIIDEVYFYSYNIVFSLLMYPMLFGLFAYRIPIYKRFFCKKDK